jgi:hypothetical protein
MPAVSRVVPAALAGVLLLAACGSQSVSQSAGSQGSADASCAADSLPHEAVRITGCTTGLSAEFEVTNSEVEAATYTVTFGFRTGAGVEHVTQTVEAVGPGRTVKGTVEMMAGPASEVSGVEVVKVRSVPVDEASSASGPCPASGVHVYADEGDAAMGLRVVGLHLVNCGTRPYSLDGYPELQLLDEDHDSVDGVRILEGTDRISTAAGGSGRPKPVVLQPGEAAQATLAWRNTTGAGVAVNAPYVRVRPRPGADPVTVVPELDLGTTGQLGAGPWKTDETYRGAPTAPTAPTRPTSTSSP